MVAHMGQTGSEKRLLFYVEQNYSFDILRPLQSEARNRGYDVRWLIIEDADPALLGTDEKCCTNVKEAIAFDPAAVFAPGDRIPEFIPGLKVQVFHGLNEDKRGDEYPERGLFDLYCTEGPSRTGMLAPLAKQRGYFKVAETGWLKLDTILAPRPTSPTFDRPQILLASTFTPRLSGADALLPEIKRLSGNNEWQWLITLHPKMDQSIKEYYKALENGNLSYFETNKVVQLLHRADLMVSDNSSVLQEFLLLKKPVVTYRNRDPQAFLIDIREPDQLENAIRQALQPNKDLRQAIDNYGPSVTPWLDGASAGRIMDAMELMLGDNWQNRKPHNLWRNLKMRRQLAFYWFW
jgi:CDP-glycerol glycerophosphotransferase (TagB/SpsB family)